MIIGRNGSGKTTLFNKIYENLKNRENIKLGYMPQNYSLSLPMNNTALEYLSSSLSKEDITRARTLMGSMKFTSEEATSKIKELSDGQKTKLILLKLILTDSNVLLLDEPTRNLSPLSNPVIREVLKEYKGTIISVSHDRKYITDVCDTVYNLTKDGLKKVNGFNELY